MSVNPPNLGFINQQAGQIALDTRANILKITWFNQYLQNLGHDNLVLLGFSSEDATQLLTVYSNMASVAKMCMGQAYTGPTLPFDFVAQTVPFWAGQ